MNASTTGETATLEGPAPGAYRPLRIWPPIVLLGLMAVARFVPTIIENGPANIWMIPAFGPVLGGLLIMVWWLIASRARWQERLIGFVGVIAVATVTLLLLDPSMRGPGIMVITLPVGLAAFALGTIACSRVACFKRTIVAVLAAACGFGFSIALRADGLWGDFAVGLHWRWTPSAEERLLASGDRGQSDLLRDMPDSELEQALLNPQWPAYRGADRSGRQHGTQLATDWVKQAPELIWSIEVGPGWSSFAVAGQLLFTQEQRGGMETTVAYDAGSGREVWVRSIESRFDDALGGPGPRATPTLADGKLYVMGAQGFLLRLDPKTGAVDWQQDLRKVAGRSPPMWGFSSSPLVQQGVVIVHAGGRDDKGVLAFDAESGELRWSATSGDHTYSSPQMCDVSGTSYVAMVSNRGLDLLDPATGQMRLQYDWPTDQYRVLQPQVFDGDSILIPTGQGTGTRRVRIVQDGDSLAAHEVWTSLQLKPDFNDFVIYQGHAYGFDAALFVCIDLENGQRRWTGGRYGKGQVLLIEDSGLLLVAGEYGDVVLLKADPSARVELAKFKALEGKTWNHPVLIGDRLYIRNAEQAACWRLPLGEGQAAISEAK